MTNVAFFDRTCNAGPLSLHAFLAFAQRAESFPGVQSGGVAIAPRHLKGIRSNLLYTFQIILAGHVGKRFGLVGFQKNGFPLAAGTRAIVAQTFKGDRAFVSVGPLNEKIAGGCFPDLFGGWHTLLTKKGQPDDCPLPSGPYRDRTGDLVNAIHALSQLS